MKTMQEVFDKVATHLLKQGARAETNDGRPRCLPMCMYRAPDGRMCAVGCLIEDEFYDPGIEGITFGCKHDPRQDFLNNVLKLSGVLVGQQDLDALLMSLQTVHDGYTPSEWRDQLAVTAKCYGLNPRVLEGPL